MTDIPRAPSVCSHEQDLQKRGFKFVGTTICYAFMQAVGMVNDHVISCFRYEELKNKGAHTQARKPTAGDPAPADLCAGGQGGTNEKSREIDPVRAVLVTLAVVLLIACAYWVFQYQESQPRGEALAWCCAL